MSLLAAGVGEGILLLRMCNSMNEEKINPDFTLHELPLTLTVTDLMRVLGIGRNTAYNLVNSGEIYSIKVGRQVRIPRQALIDYMTPRRE